MVLIDIFCLIKTQAFKNLDAVLRGAGSKLQNAVKVNIFLSSMDYYAAVNDVYAKFFSNEPKPVCLRITEAL